ncbi:hypothetical protein ACFL5Z_14865 [Planctomycetota bacterium]
MNRWYFFSIMACTVALLMCLCGGCEKNVKVVEKSEVPLSPRFLEGQQAAEQYTAGKLSDYEVVWKVYDLKVGDSQPFLDGFVRGLAAAGEQAQAVAYPTVLEEAITGNQFQTAKDIGLKHARKAVTNEQVQGIVHSSLGVSKGVALGWKAGYIRGFAAQRVAERAASRSIDEKTIWGFHQEAVATYHAIRSAIGQ